MDRVLFLAMSGAKQTARAQAANTHNMANLSTTGFKADLNQFRSMPVYGEGHPSRVYAMSERPGVDTTPGPLNSTGRELDLALRGDGWFAVQAPDGSEAYTRAGDLQINSAGILETRSGYPVLGNGGAPIAIPPSEKMEIGVDGTLSVRPIGQAPNVLAEVDRIKLVNPDNTQMFKGEDGLMRMMDGGQAVPDANVRIISGSLEGSNVSAVESLVTMIELSRQYEMQVKVMSTAKDNDAASDQMMRIS